MNAFLPSFAPSTIDPDDLKAGDEMGSELGFSGHGAFEMFILKTLAEEQRKRLSRYFSFSILVHR